MLPHLRRRHMTGIDRRDCRRQQCCEEGLRPLQMEGDLAVAVDGYLLEISVPGPAWIDAQLLARLAGQQIPGALDILGRKRLAVVPSDILAQTKGQRGLVFVPRPSDGEIGHDRAESVLRYMLIEEDEVVEDPHHRSCRRPGRLLVGRHARRAVAVGYSQNASRFLSECRNGDGHGNQQCPDRCEGAKTSFHRPLPALVPRHPVPFTAHLESGSGRALVAALVYHFGRSWAGRYGG